MGQLRRGPAKPVQSWPEARKRLALTGQLSDPQALSNANLPRTVPEEVGHGHVTYVRKRIHAVSLRRIPY